MAVLGPCMVLLPVPLAFVLPPALADELPADVDDRSVALVSQCNRVLTALSVALVRNNSSLTR